MSTKCIRSSHYLAFAAVLLAVKPVDATYYCYNQNQKPIWCPMTKGKIIALGVVLGTIAMVLLLFGIWAMIIHCQLRRASSRSLQRVHIQPPRTPARATDIASQEYEPKQGGSGGLRESTVPFALHLHRPTLGPASDVERCAHDTPARTSVFTEGPVSPMSSTASLLPLFREPVSPSAQSYGRGNLLSPSSSGRASPVSVISYPHNSRSSSPVSFYQYHSYARSTSPSSEIQMSPMSSTMSLVEQPPAAHVLPSNHSAV